MGLPFPRPPSRTQPGGTTDDHPPGRPGQRPALILDTLDTPHPEPGQDPRDAPRQRAAGPPTARGAPPPRGRHHHRCPLSSIPLLKGAASADPPWDTFPAPVPQQPAAGAGLTAAIGQGGVQAPIHHGPVGGQVRHQPARLAQSPVARATSALGSSPAGQDHPARAAAALDRPPESADLEPGPTATMPDSFESGIRPACVVSRMLLPKHPATCRVRSGRQAAGFIGDYCEIHRCGTAPGSGPGFPATDRLHRSVCSGDGKQGHSQRPREIGPRDLDECLVAQAIEPGAGSRTMQRLTARQPG